MQTTKTYMSQTELWLYSVVFCIAATMHWCLLGFTINNEDCRGAGARYPGGCPEFTEARNILIFISLAVCTATFASLMLVLLKRTLHQRTRLIIIALYDLLVIVLPFSLALLSTLLPAKV